MQLNYCHKMIYLQNKRAENMDRYLVERRLVEEEPVELYAVCDGVGSTPRGGVVAQDVVSFLWEWFYGLTTVEDIYESMLQGVYQINEVLYLREEEGGLERGATTLSALLFVRGTFFVVHLGDSRIYGRETEQWLQLTTDQTLNGALVQVIPKKEILPQYWGGEANFTHFLLATDGFYHRLPWEELERNLTNVGEKNDFMEHIARIMIDLGERDNMTGILIAPERA